MSNVEQMMDNLSYMKNFMPLSREEQLTVQKAQEAMNAVQMIPCTACHYCTAGCPKRIPISEIFAARNEQMVKGQFEKGAADYEKVTKQAGAASDCIACGQCERICPQQIPVIKRLAECADVFGK